MTQMRDQPIYAALLSCALTASSATVSSGELVRIGTLPTKAEVTGIAVNDNGELFFNAQHPAGK